MRRAIVLAVAVVLLLGLSLGVSAQTAASQIQYQASVSSDESCTVTMSVTFRLETAVPELTFPLPVDASGITLNGSRVGSTLTNEARLVDLSGITGGMAGTVTAVFTYHLKDVILTDRESGALSMELQMLSGFPYPVEGLQFTVTLPGTIAAKPAFRSGYHQANIEQDLQFSYKDNTVSGKSLKELKDHETLSMTLPVSGETFPQAVIQLQNLEPYYLAMGICGALALLYWLFFLRALPPKFMNIPAPPEGYSAGQMGTLIHAQGTDLICMVFSWAQLGYLTIQLKRDRVLLHKQMEMGNERSAFEQKCFQQLFNRDTVDTSGIRFALLCQKMWAKTISQQGLIHPRSGNKKVFRVLMTLVGLFDGICLGLTLSVEAAVQWFPALLLGAGCGIAAWLIQQWAEDLFSRQSHRLTVSLMLLAVWLILSIVAGTYALDGWILAALLLAGLMATFGGRRTEDGRQMMSEALGFRLYLMTIPRTQLHHICRQNPEYFHTVAPYALAMGCDQAFAGRFGRDLLPPCPYITGVSQKPMTAAQWSKLMRSVARNMESRLRQQPLERLTDFIHRLTK